MIEGSLSSLGEALNAFHASRKDGERQEGWQHLNRFIQWCGRERGVGELTPAEIASYVERFGGGGSASSHRFEPVKDFLTFLKKQGWITISLAPHLRLPKAKKANKRTSSDTSPQQHHLTPEGHALLQTRLELLKSESVTVVGDIQRAMADKDFRENAPLDAAKERQGFIEASIRKLEEVLNHAVVGGPEALLTKERRTAIGHRVTLRDLQSGKEVIYTLVDSREADPTAGKISSISPVGRALLGKVMGDEIQITVPMGTLRYVIGKVDAG